MAQLNEIIKIAEMQMNLDDCTVFKFFTFKENNNIRFIMYNQEKYIGDAILNEISGDISEITDYDNLVPTLYKLIRLNVFTAFGRYSVILRAQNIIKRSIKNHSFC